MPLCLSGYPWLANRLEWTPHCAQRIEAHGIVKPSRRSIEPGSRLIFQSLLLSVCLAQQTPEMQIPSARARCICH